MAVRTFLTTSFMLMLGPVFAQVKISGVVTAEGLALPGVNIFLADTYDGATSNATGKFEFATGEKGRKILTAKFLGYKDFTKEIEIGDEDVNINIDLDEAINELEAVTITAGTFSASDESRRTVFRALDIATTAGATADIAGALNTLPGTQKVGETGRLFVRGGDGNEARTFIDGLLVLDAYSPSAPNTPSRGRFLPFMFKGTSFSTGGYSAEYGQALSSALVLDSKDQAEATRTDIGILSVGGDIGHTHVWERGSIAGKLEYTNLQPYIGLISQEVDWQDAPLSVEGSAAFRHQVGKNGMFKFFGNFSHSTFSLYQHSIDDYNQKVFYRLTNDYQYLNGFYKNSINENWSVRGGVSFTCQQDDVHLDDANIDKSRKGLHIKSVVEGSITDQVELKSGIEVISRWYDETFAQDVNQRYSFQEVITSAFVEGDVYASNDFVIRTAGRVEHNNLTNQLSIDPRISLAYKVGTHGQASVAYGKFRQSAKDEFLRTDPALNPEKADHYILNYQTIKDKRTFRIETFYKRYNDLIRFENSDPDRLTNLGSGDAKGIELFWRDNASVERLDYWISYSYLDTKREYLDFPAEATPTFASTHNFSIVTKYFVQKIKSQLGLTCSFASGRPYNNPNAGTFNSGRTPNYADVSFNWSYLPTTSIIIHFSCTNLLGRDNIFGYEYSKVRMEDGTFNSRAIRQAAPRFLFLGIFITLSKDKSVNQLPSL